MACAKRRKTPGRCKDFSKSLLLDWTHLQYGRCGAVTIDETQRLAQKLTREELEELARLVGPEARDKWWYRLGKAQPLSAGKRTKRDRGKGEGR